jgi:NAD-dependent oxidoreductase involved in siderophore biosynthesis
MPLEGVSRFLDPKGPVVWILSIFPAADADASLRTSWCMTQGECDATHVANDVAGTVGLWAACCGDGGLSLRRR